MKKILLSIFILIVSAWAAQKDLPAKPEAAGPYEFDYAFPFSGSKQAKKTYRGKIKTHVAIKITSASKTLQGAVLEGKKKIGTRYPGVVRGWKCEGDPEDDSMEQKECWELVKRPRIVGLEIYQGEKLICKMGDSGADTMICDKPQMDCFKVDPPVKNSKPKR